jgi:N-methylhydantoinase A
MRFAVDVGGTFTDLVVEQPDGSLLVRKSPSTPSDPAKSVLDVLALAARDRGESLAELLAQGKHLVHGTTRAINAILTGTAARTAFLTTQGHPDVLLIREAGRDVFNRIEEWPDPYVPRSLTFEVPERIGSQGEVVRALDEERTREIVARLQELDVEAVAVCLLWSTVNPAHEQRVGALLAESLPGVPFTLSHALNPTMREYRRASSTAIDASLKPVMARYLADLETRLGDAGFSGRLLMSTSSGGMMDIADVAAAPIHLINSGPAMAPVAGRHYAEADAGARTILVADTGGTSYDVSVVRDGVIPSTRETWLGEEWLGHMTGFPSIDVRSIGAGGGSIAWVDEGGLLHVGPQSAGAEPGAVCYGRGGTLPTVTDACAVLGYLDPDYFLGGDMPLDIAAAARAIEREVGAPLGLGVDEAAAAVMRVVTENMVQLIEELSLNQGVDPRSAVLVGGGGAAGLNAVAIARRLNMPQVVIPETGATLSAVGGLLSDLSAEYATTFVTTSQRFDYDTANHVLASLVEQCDAFAARAGHNGGGTRRRLSAEMRYPSEVWELEVPLRVERIGGPDDVEAMRQDLHAARDAVYGTHDPEAPAHVVAWRARVSCTLRSGELGRPGWRRSRADARAVRDAYFEGLGRTPVPVRYFEALPTDASVPGPLLVESPVTTVVVDPGATVRRTQRGSLLITPRTEETS